MKWFLTFLAGALCGVLGLFLFLSMTPYDTAPPQSPAVAVPPVTIPAPVVAPVAAPPAPPPALPPPAPAPAEVPAPPATVAPPAISSDSAGTGLPAATPAPALPAAIPPVAGTDIKPSDKLLIPVEGIKSSQLIDTFNQSRGTERRHEALDIMAPKGTKVVAVADGKVAKLFHSKPGGLTVYQFDATEKFAYYYAHLDRYAPGIAEGMSIKRGDPIGYVGTTGNADPGGPHLHFAIFALTPEKKWWKGTPLNPYPLLRE